MTDIDEVAPERIRAVINQTAIPVLIRRGKGHQLRVRLPYALTNKGWLGASGRNHPVWDAKRKVWEVPQAWFDDLVKRCLERFGNV